MDKAGREYVRLKMPIIGLGTYEVKSEKVIKDIIDAALEVGYRFIDTAQVYGNEKYIGSALKELLPKYNLTR
jgi:2,5-diketo-D-gluconate reductase B